MTEPRTARAKARESQTAAIKDTARRLIAEKGVSGLSLREVARELGLVSSALYRYFATRDELLTALIVDAYDELGAAVERADARCARGDVRARWVAVTRAVRRWATRNPNEYALIYGTPVPGYVAPELTIPAATRVPVVLASIVSENERRRNASTPAPRPALSTPASGELARVYEIDALAEVMVDVPPEMYTRSIMAWTHVFGFLNFELFGHYVGAVRDYSAMFDDVVAELAGFLGLED
jgi:AcrR family transcriptional regulator